jgi:sugar O-acyltransferase (sialic acid O-acetyltransferase NeuD family)
MINMYGKGGHARMIASLTEETVSFYDDSDYYKAKDLLWIIGVGNNQDRKKVAERLIDSEFVSIDLGTYVASDVTMGEGILIAPGAVVQNGVTLGNHVIVNTSASVDHDCEIGDYCHIAPNTTLCGAVKIGAGTLIGAGSVVLPCIEIGENCIIGAGSVVTKNIPSNSKVYGNPAKIK